MSVSPELWLSQDEIEERRFEADVLYRWGRYEEYSIRYPQALHHLHQAKYIYASLHQTQQRLRTKLVLARVYLLTGKINKAHEMGQAVQQQYLTNGDMIEYSKSCNFMGNCYAKWDDYMSGF